MIYAQNSIGCLSDVCAKQHRLLKLCMRKIKIVDLKKIAQNSLLCLNDVCAK